MVRADAGNSVADGGGGSAPAAAALPSELGFKAWNFDPLLITTNAAITHITVALARLPLRTTDPITKLHLYLYQGASGTTGYVGLYSLAGVQLAVSGSTAFSAGVGEVIDVTLAGDGYTPSEPGEVYAAILGVGGDQPRFGVAAHQNFNSSSGKLATSALRFCNAESSHATLPGTLTPSTTATYPFWVAAS